ncbi:hypothetical protein [Rhizobium sp. 11_C7_N12_5]|uniref:hypothetical protein n=1 Tax=Rhizobium sp. 11_C7_N12_5 TaxID=3240770 RepID=UPI003F1FB5BD
MTTTSEDNDRIVVSYVRQPDEHIAVMRQAGRRLAVRRTPNAYDRWSPGCRIPADSGLLEGRTGHPALTFAPDRVM